MFADILKWLNQYYYISLILVMFITHHLQYEFPYNNEMLLLQVMSYDLILRKRSDLVHRWAHYLEVRQLMYVRVIYIQWII